MDVARVRRQQLWHLAARSKCRISIDSVALVYFSTAMPRDPAWSPHLEVNDGKFFSLQQRLCKVVSLSSFAKYLSVPLSMASIWRLLAAASFAVQVYCDFEPVTLYSRTAETQFAKREDYLSNLFVPKSHGSWSYINGTKTIPTMPVLTLIQPPKHLNWPL